MGLQDGDSRRKGEWRVGVVQYWKKASRDTAFASQLEYRI